MNCQIWAIPPQDWQHSYGEAGPVIGVDESGGRGGGMACTVRKFNWWLHCLTLCDEMFAHFPLFDETLRHTELCNSVISQPLRNPSTLFYQCTACNWPTVPHIPRPFVTLIYSITWPGGIVTWPWPLTIHKKANNMSNMMNNISV